MNDMKGESIKSLFSDMHEYVKSLERPSVCLARFKARTQDNGDGTFTILRNPHLPKEAK